LVERSEQFDFVAPLDGYREFDEILTLKNTEHWLPDQSKNYFLRLSDDRFARLIFRMIAQGDHYFRIECHLNPVPGHRNLEYDPAKRINQK
jgi:hypothetical protein